MKKAQRRARLKELKRKEKLARKLGSDTAVAEDVVAVGDDSPAETLPAAGADSANACLADPVADDRPVDRDEAMRVVRDAASARVAEARSAERAARELDDARARAMLQDAAELLHEILTDTREALAHVSPERKREALVVINEKPEPSEVGAQKRPRRGPDPVVSLMRIGMQAASLLRRIIAKTNPELGQLKRAA